MVINLPIILTLIRIALIPLFVVIYYLPYGWAWPLSALIFALAGITDWLDGYLARRLSQTSAFGAFLDPVADKLMVAVALVMLVGQHHSLYLAVPAMIIIGREIAISALREWMAEIGRPGSVAVKFIGKVKTTLQIIALLLLLYHHPLLGIPTHLSGLVLLNIAAALTLWSMVVYLYAVFHELKAG
ncbi:MAG: CDP-diacylglycerol--glycerol-3-phosphate 3-phosphatidyltransferase [Gammaproteobacteria bacterium]|nr:CDP-diacylglycerol--glycerol-3-phosphate 3-phosphatidyltransferase [Gammaproteobacteria bacterium]